MFRKIIFCFCLLFQNVIQVVLTRYSLINDGEVYLATVATLIDDIIKLVLCFLIIWIFVERGNLYFVFERLHREILIQRRGFLMLSLPALLYVIQDNLVFLALRKMEGAEFQTMFQLKLIITSILSVLFLKRTITSLQWISQIILIAGVVFIKWHGLFEKDTGNKNDFYIGLLAVLGACLTSSVAGVYFEYFFKDHSEIGSELDSVKSSKSTFSESQNRNKETRISKLKFNENIAMSMWVSELSLALWSLPFGFIGLLLKDWDAVQRKGVFQGFSIITWITITVAAVGGFFSLVVVLNLDNIIKNLTYSLSFIPVALVSIYVFGTHPGLNFYIGSILLIISFFLYLIPKKKISLIRKFYELNRNEKIFQANALSKEYSKTTTDEFRNVIEIENQLD